MINISRLYQVDKDMRMQIRQIIITPSRFYRSIDSNNYQLKPRGRFWRRRVRWGAWILGDVARNEANRRRLAVDGLWPGCVVERLYLVFCSLVRLIGWLKAISCAIK